MRFFKSKRSKEDLINSLNIDENIKSWWENVRNEYTFGFLSSHQTRQLDASIASFSEIVEETQRKEALQKLYTQILNWERMHMIMSRHSDREGLVAMLKNKIEKLLELPSPLDEEQIAQMRYQRSVGMIPKENASAETSDQNLYTWWKIKSNLGWFSRRSPATKELDHAIRWFSNNAMSDTLAALQVLMDALEVWKQEREALSRRVSAVEWMQGYISNEMSKLLECHRQATPAL